MWRRWGIPQNFCLAFTDELEKQIFIKKQLSGPIKNKITLIFIMLHFFKKNKEKHLEILLFHTCTKNLNDMIYSSWDIKRNKLKLVILGHFLLLYPTKNQKIKILKKWKKMLEILSFYICAPKITFIWCMVSEIRSPTDIIFCHFGPFFALLPF